MDDFEIENDVLKNYKGCDSIVYVPQGVKIIGKSAFAFWDNVKKVVLPNSVHTIGENAFAECLDLQEIVIPESVTRIERNAFYNNYIQKITLPRSIKYIGKVAFGRCASLDNLYFQGTKAEWNKITLDTPIIDYSTSAHHVICIDGTVGLSDI